MNRWPLIAMENTLCSAPSLDWNARCATIAAAGFDGVYAVPYPLTDEDFPRLHHLAEAPQRHGLRLAGVYTNIDLALPPEHPTNARVTRLFAETEGAPVIELSFKCSSPAALPATPDGLDAAIAARLEPLLTIADRRGLKVALYPHSFYPLETPAHAASLVSRIAHPRLSYLFATSHVYAVSEPASVIAQLTACAGEISSFNICGCSRSAPGPRAKCLHSPLDEGDLDLTPLFSALNNAGHEGDIIVQGHGWSGDLAAMLRRCVAWHAALDLPRC
jgi:sugar phosphate isomerase/epimerase